MTVSEWLHIPQSGWMNADSFLEWIRHFTQQPNIQKTYPKNQTLLTHKKPKPRTLIIKTIRSLILSLILTLSKKIEINLKLYVDVAATYKA